MNGASVETVPPKTRRRYSAAEKLRIVTAADAALASGEPGAVGTLLRREGIYSSHLAAWRKQLRANGTKGLEARKPGRKPKLDAKDRQLLAANKELAKLRRQLEVANAVIDLQKKGSPDEDVGQERLGSGGQRPPSLSMARAISGLWEWKPKASRVMRRSLVLAASMRAFERPNSRTL